MRRTTKILNYLIASVWLVNGLFCKVLNLVPRHEQIVAKILGDEHSRFLTASIGFAEIAMSIWILTKFKSKLNTITQIVIIATMNVIEFLKAPELLLWHKFNIVFASLFIIIIFLNEFLSNIETKSLIKT